jgi:hypothetical protein
MPQFKKIYIHCNAGKKEWRKLSSKLSSDSYEPQCDYKTGFVSLCIIKWLKTFSFKKCKISFCIVKATEIVVSVGKAFFFLFLCLFSYYCYPLRVFVPILKNKLSESRLVRHRKKALQRIVVVVVVRSIIILLRIDFMADPRWRHEFRSSSRQSVRISIAQLYIFDWQQVMDSLPTLTSTPERLRSNVYLYRPRYAMSRVYRSSLSPHPKLGDVSHFTFPSLSFRFSRF